MDEVKTAYAWQEAMELAQELVEVCENFSSDSNVLLGHLRQAVVDIPATVAIDLKFGRMATMEPVIRLATELELVHKVYPAIDTAEVPAKLQALIERMSSNRFVERQPAEVEPSGEGAESPEPVAVQSADATEETKPSVQSEPSQPSDDDEEEGYIGSGRGVSRMVPVRSTDGLSRAQAPNPSNSREA
jgi:hypothetical protein